jgi:hypothetical protein
VEFFPNFFNRLQTAFRTQYLTATLGFNDRSSENTPDLGTGSLESGSGAGLFRHK